MTDRHQARSPQNRGISGWRKLVMAGKYSQIQAGCCSFGTGMHSFECTLMRQHIDYSHIRQMMFVVSRIMLVKDILDSNWRVCSHSQRVDIMQDKWAKATLIKAKSIRPDSWSELLQNGKGCELLSASNGVMRSRLYSCSTESGNVYEQLITYNTWICFQQLPDVSLTFLNHWTCLTNYLWSCLLLSWCTNSSTS